MSHYDALPGPVVPEILCGVCLKAPKEALYWEMVGTCGVKRFPAAMCGCVGVAWKFTGSEWQRIDPMVNPTGELLRLIPTKAG